MAFPNIRIGSVVIKEAYDSDGLVIKKGKYKGMKPRLTKSQRSKPDYAVEHYMDIFKCSYCDKEDIDLGFGRLVIHRYEPTKDFAQCHDCMEAEYT